MGPQGPLGTGDAQTAPPLGGPALVSKFAVTENAGIETRT